jgi:hypothetical protein
MAYEPTDPPVTGELPELRSWLAGELRRLADEFNLGQREVINLAINRSVNVAPFVGPQLLLTGTLQIAAFGADAITPGSAAGLYARLEAGAWVKLD